eukprot:c47420_g1_i1 orf=253-699(+)
MESQNSCLLLTSVLISFCSIILCKASYTLQIVSYNIKYYIHFSVHQSVFVVSGKHISNMVKAIPSSVCLCFSMIHVPLCFKHLISFLSLVTMIPFFFKHLISILGLVMLAPFGFNTCMISFDLHPSDTLPLCPKLLISFCSTNWIPYF